MALRFCVLAFLAIFSSPAWAANKSIQVRWLYANIPEDPRPRDLITDAVKRINERAAGRLVIEIVPLIGIGRDGPNFGTAVRRLLRGEGEISQVSTYSLMGIYPRIEVVDLPFLFRDFGHAARVLNGPLGKEIADGLPAASGDRLRALDLTYTGGFRVIVSDRRTRTLADLSQLRIERIIRTYRTPEDPRTTTVRADGLEALGVGLRADVSRQSELENYQAGYMNAGDDHWGHFSRVMEKYGNPGIWKDFFDTEHSLFVSAIVVNESFYRKLPADLRALLDEEIHALAVREAATSPGVDRENRAWVMKHYPRITQGKPSAKEKAAMLRAVEPIYRRYEPIFGKELIDRIRSLP